MVFMKKVVAIIPAYNEERRVGEIVRGARKHVDAVLVVDDGSSDRTAEVAEKAGAQVLRLPENRGTGYATRAGARQAMDSLKAGLLVFIDADGQHNPGDIPRLLARLGEGCGVVFTARRFSGTMPPVKRLGNWWLTLWTRLLSGVAITDSQSGFKAMTAGAFRKLRLKSDRYDTCSEIVFEVGRRKLGYCEVPIATLYPALTTRKGTSITDGAGIFLQLLRLRLGW